MRHRGSFGLAALLTFGSSIQADPLDGFGCSAHAGAPLLRAEGITELVGDIVLTCTGGEPTPAGQRVPLVNFQVFLNTDITSRVLNQLFTDALLAIDDPSAANQRIGGGPTTAYGLTGVGSGIDYATPGSPINGGQNVRNIFQGQRQRSSDRHLMVWLGVPVDPPGTTTTRSFRITNVRANANQLGTSPTQILAYITAAGPNGSIPIASPAQVVGNVQPGLDFTVIQANSRKDCVSWNPNPTGPTAEPAGVLRFVELSAAAFRRRNIAQSGPPQPQNTFGTVYNTETGVYNPAFGMHPVGGNLGTGGLSDSGSRLMTRFSNVPANVQIWVANSAPLIRIDTPATTGVAGLISPLPATGTARTRVALVNGAGSATYEIGGGNPNVLERADISYYASYTATGIFGDIGVGTAFVFGNLATLGTQTGAASAFIPRFGDTSNFAGAGFGAFNIEACPDSSPAFNLAQAQPMLNFPGEKITPYLNLVLSTPTPPVTNVREEAFLQQGNAPGNPATAGWLSAILNQTKTPATVTVRANPAGLSPGVYNGTVRISSTASANGPISYPVRLTVTAPPPFLPFFGAGSAASYAAGEVSPGEAMVFFGERFGPASLVTLALNPDGSVATTLGETRVLFDGQAAPMIYAAPNQVSAFAPFGIAGRSATQVEIEYRGVKSAPVTLVVVPARPGILTADTSGTGQAAALNQDFSVNGRGSPASPGDVVAVFGTGGGDTDPPGRDGQFAGAGGTLGKLKLPVTATINGAPAKVVYAGPAPGLIEGVLQVNLEIAATAVSGDLPVSIVVGDRPSQAGVTIAVRRPAAAGAKKGSRR